MNIQGLIDYCNVLKESKNRFINCIDVDRIIYAIKQLDEPQKVKVPQFVADWYEENKDEFETSLFQCIYELFKKRNDSELNEFENWVIDENTKPFQTLVNMHQFGYEVEEEKKYFVKLKAVDQYLVSVKDEDFLGFLQSRLRSKFTRKELEDANLGWVFNCEGVEVEEVKDEHTGTN